MLALPLVVFSPVLSLGADSPAIKALKEKGLTRSGRFFLLDAEQPVLDKWKSTRAVMADYNAVAARRNEAELAARESAQLEGRRTELQEHLNDLDQKINVQGFQQGNNRPVGFGQGAYLSQLMAQRDMIRINLAEIASMQKSVKADRGTDAKTLDAESKKALEAAKAALAEFRGSVNAVTKRYDQLGSDAAVKSALHALEEDRMGTFKLGPSAPFKAVVKALEKAEATILAKKAAAVPRKKGRSRK